MSNFNYSKEEEKKIRQAMALILEDIYKLKQGMSEEEVVIRLDNGSGDEETFTGWDCVFLRIYNSNDKVVLSDEWWDKQVINLKPSVLRRSIPLQFCLLFIDKYDFIRNSLISSIENSSNMKVRQMRKVDDIIDRCSKDTFVEIDLPETQNRHKVVVSREGDKTVGVINFGYSSIKLVTKGDLVLINKDEENKNDRVKRIK